MIKDRIDIEIANCEKKLSILNVQIADQLSKSYTERDGRLLAFLTREKAIYDYAFRILNELQNEL